MDVGSSAGLNLLCDRYRLDYGPAGVTGPLDSPVTVECAVQGGEPPIARSLPELVARVGIDRSTVDLSEPGDVRWLLACVWPDTGRLDRTRAAVGLARLDPPTVREGDANELLPGVLDTLPSDAVRVVSTTWSFSYFSLEQRAAFEALLSEASSRGPVAWLCGDGTGVSASLAERAGDSVEPTDQLLGFDLFDDGDRESVLLARGPPSRELARVARSVRWRRRHLLPDGDDRRGGNDPATGTGLERRTWWPRRSSPSWSSGCPTACSGSRGRRCATGSAFRSPHSASCSSRC